MFLILTYGNQAIKMSLYQKFKFKKIQLLISRSSSERSLVRLSSEISQATVYSYPLKYITMIKAEMLQRHEAQATIHYSLGDLSHQPVDVRTHIINASLIKTLETRTTLDELRIQKETQRLKAEVDEFETFVQNPSNYPTGSRETIISFNKEADNNTKGQDIETRVAARIAKFNGIHIVLDYDNTITDNTQPLNSLSGLTQTNPLSHLETLIPGSILAEPLLKDQGRGKFAEVFVNTWQVVLKDPKGSHFLRSAGTHTPFRKGVSDFFAYAQNRDAKLTIVSANFEPFVMGGLDQITEAEGTNVLAVTDKSIIPTAKGAVLLHLAQKDPSRGLIYVGDGESDKPAIQAKDLIVCYFALEGSGFAKALEEEELPNFTYRDFNDITLKLQQINAINNRLAA